MTEKSEEGGIALIGWYSGTFAARTARAKDKWSLIKQDRSLPLVSESFSQIENEVFAKLWS